MNSAAIWIVSLVCSVLALPVFADELPSGASTPSTYDLTRTYVGHTEVWDQDCYGGIYYGPNGQARAWCRKNPGGFAAGVWSVDAYGRMCHQLTWYYVANGKVGSSLGERACTSHVVDRRNSVWRNWPGSAEWWPAKSDTLVRGYLFQDQILAIKRQMGI